MSKSEELKTVRYLYNADLVGFFDEEEFNCDELLLDCFNVAQADFEECEFGCMPYHLDPEKWEECLSACRGEHERNKALCNSEYDECKIGHCDEPGQGYYSNLLCAIRNNKLNFLVEQQELLTRSGEISLVSGQFFKYLYFGENNYKPESNYKIYTEEALQENIDMAIITENELLINENYNKTATYNYFQVKGNIIEDKVTSNPEMVYYWGFNKSYPIVIAENVSYDVLKELVDSSIPTEYESIDDYLVFLIGIEDDEQKKRSWEEFNNELRENASIYNTKIRTYTYEPLIGVSSITSENEKVRYFKYDSFVRLVTVINKNGAILKHIEYNMKNLDE